MNMNSIAKTKNTPEGKCLGDILVQSNIDILKQLVSALNYFEETHYQKQGIAKSSSIGMHMRHIIEFYQEFFLACGTTPHKDICYDARQRNLFLETSRKSALQELQTLEAEFNAMTLDDKTMTLSVIVDAEAPLIPLATSLHRELYHLLDHTIHHMALIKTLAQQQELTLNDDFGVAKATQKHQKQAK